MPSVNNDDVEKHDEHDMEEQEAAVHENAPTNAAQDIAAENVGDEKGPEDSDSDESASPSILSSMGQIGFDEAHEGHNYALLKEQFDRQQRYMDRLAEHIVKISRESRKNKKEIRKKEREIQGLEDRLRGIREPPVPWQQLLRAYLRDEGDYPYSKIYHECCKQENMSQREVFHPDFSIQNEVISDEKRELEKRLLEERNPRLLTQERAQGGDEPDDSSASPGFPFEKLPSKIQAQIFGLVLVKGTLIHCLSRLDPDNPPVDFPDNDIKDQSQLPTRFHFGTSPCQIILARKPNDVLSPLMVCKRWYFIGAHIFYGANTFAFSSLGEWHRFCQGIGKARVQRLVNVELMWHGALMPRHETGISQRTLGLYSFTETSRLRTLVVHISEGQVRRKYEIQKGKNKVQPTRDVSNIDKSEPTEDKSSKYESDENESDDSESDENRTLDKSFDPFKAMVSRTKRQPNFRGFRSMRTVQGIDCLYQLRGMNWIRFEESNGPNHRQKIRDWSFIKDINTVVTLPKQPHDAHMSELENLRPLTCLEDFIPSKDDTDMIQELYDEAPFLDLVGGSETTVSANGYSSDIPPWDSTSIGDSNDDGDSSGDNAGISGKSHKPRSNNTVPLPKTSRQRNSQIQGEGNSNEEDRMDIDDGRSSSALFVPSGSGSGGPSSERMEVDNPTEQVNSEAVNQTGGGQSRNQAGSDNESESLFVRSEPDARPNTSEPKLKSVKLEPDDSPGINKAIKRMMIDDNDSDSDNDKYAREETPPGSDDDDDDDDSPYLAPPTLSNTNPSPPSPNSSSKVKRRKLA
ncbi:hypothetical protein F4774DRAFT_419685 [Daldinia eschscholtzii]|nr:hypothetical protein F4774DRAFT_419685 [Daldinia eschscholtzii]